MFQPRPRLGPHRRRQMPRCWPLQARVWRCSISISCTKAWHSWGRSLRPYLRSGHWEPQRTAGPAPGQPLFVAPNGLIAGTVATNGPTNAMLWYKKLKLNIAKPGLGGANSVAFAVDGAGQAVGEAETSVVDPKGEDFCGFKAMG